jgi:hypothetical protein
MSKIFHALMRSLRRKPNNIWRGWVTQNPLVDKHFSESIDPVE